jgi:hypothetical protein
MSIKRSSKSTGTGARRPVTSPGVRHVEVAAPHQMVPGNQYSGWLCKNKSCGLLIAIAAAPGADKPSPAQSDDSLVVIKCPHCADENLYRLSARSEHPYAPKRAGP